jgi:hypothetical protein
MYTVWCYQELNGRRIHQWPNEELLIGGGGSEWLRRGWISRLMAVQDAFGWKGWVESTRELASVGFHANG